MLNLDDTIKALRHCSILDKPHCKGCPMGGPGFGFACRDSLMKYSLHYLSIIPQYMWERNIAITQLHSIGKELGEKMDDGGV